MKNCPMLMRKYFVAGMMLGLVQAKTIFNRKFNNISLPELYGMKQLGLYSNFFMNLTDPFSLRQNNERSPRDKTK